MKDFLSKITLGAAFKKAKKYCDEHGGGGAGFEAVIGWKAGTQPDVTKIPTGVTVEYQGVTYTGTLAASEETKGQIVLIAIPDGTQPNIYNEYITVTDDTVYSWELIGSTKIDLEGYAKQVVIAAAENKTVNGYQVPKLTDEDLTTIYNAIVAGDSVVIADATGAMFFAGINADVVSDEIFVSFRYFDKMILEYGENNATTWTNLEETEVQCYDEDGTLSTWKVTMKEV